MWYPVSFAPTIKLYILATSSSTNSSSTFIPIGPANPTFADVALNTSSDVAISKLTTPPKALDTLTSLTSLSPLTITATIFPSALNIKVFANFFSVVLKNLTKSSIVLASGVSTLFNSFNSSAIAFSGVDGAFSILAA